MQETLLHLKQTLALIAAGEPSGPLGLLIVLAGVALLVTVGSWLGSSIANFVGSIRYRDPEARKKYLEGDE